MENPFALAHSYRDRVPRSGIDWQPDPITAPHVLVWNHQLARELTIEELNVDQFVRWVLDPPLVPTPYAQAYAGHQFGSFNPQLGDGRAVVLGELIDSGGVRRDVALKGSGRTPFSRGGDGKAAIGPMVRELLISEYLHAVGIPTTRGLAVVSTGETVWRDGPISGGLLIRVASSHLRVGTAQFFAARADTPALDAFIDYCQWRHPSEEAGPRGLFRAVVQRQAQLIAQWMSIGFIHGVMNTDNMTISGETIDYGPCAFLDRYDPDTVYSSIDRTGRYAYRQQPLIAKWNLARFAEALLTLKADPDEEDIQQYRSEIEEFDRCYETAFDKIFARKLGFEQPSAVSRTLQAQLMSIMQEFRLDFTSTFADLNAMLAGTAAVPDPLDEWTHEWHTHLDDGAPERLARANPILVPRNHLIEEAISAAVGGELEPVMTAFAAMRSPYDIGWLGSRWTVAPPPGFNEGYQTFCGT